MTSVRLRARPARLARAGRPRRGGHAGPAGDGTGSRSEAAAPFAADAARSARPARRRNARPTALPSSARPHRRPSRRVGPPLRRPAWRPRSSPAVRRSIIALIPPDIGQRPLLRVHQRPRAAVARPPTPPRPPARRPARSCRGDSPLPRRGDARRACAARVPGSTSIEATSASTSDEVRGGSLSRRMGRPAPSSEGMPLSAVRPNREHQLDASPAGARDAGEGRHRGRVRALHVVHEEEDGPLLGHRGHRFAGQASGVGVGLARGRGGRDGRVSFAKRRHARGDGGQRARRRAPEPGRGRELAEDRVGQCRGCVRPGSGHRPKQDCRAARLYSPDELVRESGLADARSRR